MVTPHRTGPVRSDAAREAVLAATAELFLERGYDRLTIEGIAQRAGVGKQTVYRWWASKGALIVDCLLSGMILPETLTLQDTGDIRRDLTTWFSALEGLLREPRGEDLLRSLVAAAAEHPEVGRKLHAALAGDDAISARFQAAVEAGELDENIPVRVLSEALIGFMILRALMREPLDPGDSLPLFEMLLR